MEIAQTDDDPQLEIAIGYNQMQILKERLLMNFLAEANWSSEYHVTHQWTEGWPYGLAMGDLDGDEKLNYKQWRSWIFMGCRYRQT